MSNVIRVLNNNFLQFVTKDSANYSQCLTVSVASIQHISWPMNTQINIYLDDKQFELLYNTPEEASINYKLLTTLLSKNEKLVRWDMPIPDLMTDLMVDETVEYLNPMNVIEYKNQLK